MRAKGTAMALFWATWPLFLIGAAPAPGETGEPVVEIDCSRCHYCEKPAAENRCLKPCPTMTVREVTAAHSIAEAPGSIVLGSIAKLYGPVRFDHKAHAGMAEMGLKCATCHHYSPPGRIPPCRDCHGGEANPSNLRQPTLKGAYHRHCLACHREWSHQTRCVLCHAPVDSAMAPARADTTDILGIAHPVIDEPVERVYHTPYAEGPVVTFHHREHVELYGLSCAGCHKDESCDRCHDIRKPRPAPDEATNLEKMAAVHRICENCHGSDRCEKCHDTKEKPPFTHDATGWPLGRFHHDLRCRSCHPTGRPISRLDRGCTACHGGWNAETFSHAVTGLRLDETHGEFNCDACHLEGRFDRKPSCVSCHDEERDPKKETPGEYVGP